MAHSGRNVLGILLLALVSCGNPAGDGTAVNPVKPPEFDPPAGTYDHDIELSITSSETGSWDVYFTLNGTAATPTFEEYWDPIPIAGHGTARTVKAYLRKYTDGKPLYSDVVEAAYRIQYPAAAAPVLDPPPATYDGDLKIYATSDTAGATVRKYMWYSILEPTDPQTAAWKNYWTWVPLGGDGTDATVMAIASKDGMADAVTVGHYGIRYPQAATPVLEPAGGTYAGEVRVTISCATPDASIYYTTDGSEPNPSTNTLHWGGSQHWYQGPISLGEVGISTIIKAIAVKDGMKASGSSSAAYAVSLRQFNLSVDYAGLFFEITEQETDGVKSLFLLPETNLTSPAYRWTLDGEDFSADPAVEIRGLAAGTHEVACIASEGAATASASVVVRAVGASVLLLDRDDVPQRERFDFEEGGMPAFISRWTDSWASVDIQRFDNTLCLCLSGGSEHAGWSSAGIGYTAPFGLSVSSVSFDVYVNTVYGSVLAIASDPGGTETVEKTSSWRRITIGNWPDGTSYAGVSFDFQGHGSWWPYDDSAYVDNIEVVLE